MEHNGANMNGTLIHKPSDFNNVMNRPQVGSVNVLLTAYKNGDVWDLFNLVSPIFDEFGMISLVIRII